MLEVGFYYKANRNVGLEYPYIFDKDKVYLITKVVEENEYGGFYITAIGNYDMIHTVHSNYQTFLESSKMNELEFKNYLNNKILSYPKY